MTIFCLISTHTFKDGRYISLFTSTAPITIYKQTHIHLHRIMTPSSLDSDNSNLEKTPTSLVHFLSFGHNTTVIYNIRI